MEPERNAVGLRNALDPGSGALPKFLFICFTVNLVRSFFFFFFLICPNFGFLGKRSLAQLESGTRPGLTVMPRRGRVTEHTVADRIRRKRQQERTHRTVE